MDTGCPDGAVGDASPSDLEKIGENPSENQKQHLPCRHQPQEKKQLRRRHSIGRPSQEKLLNMAEARREIVAALKFHRATMKRAAEKQRQQKELLRREAPPLLDGQQTETRTRKNTIVFYPSNTTHNSFSRYSSSNSLSSQSYPQLSWDDNTVSPLPFPDNLNHILPKKPLGLNLNFDCFTNMHTTLNTDHSNHPSQHPSSSCPHSDSPLISTTASSSTEVKPDGPCSTALYPATVGEEHKAEWKVELINSAISAWWCKFMETKEVVSPDQVLPLGAGNGGGAMEGEGDDLHSFDGVLDIPAWLGEQEQLDEYYHSQDTALPCLEIGEIEGMDCEWLS